MKAMILAAGLGARLRPLTDNLPKPLLPINGRPLIRYTLLLLKKYGIKEVVINLHHHGDKIKEALKNEVGLKINYSFEPEILGTGGGLKKASSFLSDGPFFVINGDILVDINLDSLLGFHQSKKAEITMVLRKDPNVDSWGAVEVNLEGRIRKIVGQPAHGESGLCKRMFTGVHVMSPNVFQYIPDKGFFNIMDAYREMIREDYFIMGYETENYWIDIGTPERYQKAQQDLAGGRDLLSYLKKN